MFREQTISEEAAQGAAGGARDGATSAVPLTVEQLPITDLHPRSGQPPPH